MSFTYLRNRNFYPAAVAMLIFLACKQPKSKEERSNEPIEDPSVPQTMSSGSKGSSNTFYYNLRYDFFVAYPGRVLIQQPESANGDGAAFTNMENATVMLAFARRAEDAEGNPVSLQSAFRQQLAELRQMGSSITYTFQRGEYVVLSGFRNDSIFYQKILSRQETLVYLQLLYPARDSLRYKPYIADIASSLK